jgi:hypothetical protein
MYIRLRGKVMGPYDMEKLQSLARRGQLSRMHELSQDATNWVRASTYPELFVSENKPPAVVTRSASGEVREALPGGGQVLPAPGRHWWYRKSGSEVGPVDQAALQQVLASGILSADDVVWADGMSQWVPARQVPGLLPVQTAPWLQQGEGELVVGTAERKDELPVSLCKAATNSRAWVIFIAVVSYIYAGLAILAGIFALIYGAKDHLPQVVAWGLFQLIWGVDVAAGGFLLSNYASRVASLRYSNHAAVLEKSLDTLRTLWIYVSVNLIVFLALLVFVVVWVFAVGATFPWP